MVPETRILSPEEYQQMMAEGDLVRYSTWWWDLDDGHQIGISLGINNPSEEDSTKLTMQFTVTQANLFDSSESVPTVTHQFTINDKQYSPLMLEVARIQNTDLTPENSSSIENPIPWLYLFPEEANCHYAYAQQESETDAFVFNSVTPDVTHSFRLPIPKFLEAIQFSRNNVPISVGDDGGKQVSN